MTHQQWQLKLLHDSLCPMCAIEVKFLRRRDRSHSLEFEDIASPEFDASKYGLTLQETVGAMHAIRADGSIARGPDVFIEAYRLVGLRWLAGILAFGPLRPLVNLGYRIFAKIRPKFSRFDPASCEAGRCKIT